MTFTAAPPTLPDNIAYLRRLFPDWEPGDEELALWTRKLSGTYDQRRVRDAIEGDKIAAGRFKSPNLGKVLEKLGGDKAERKRGADEDAKYAWARVIAREAPEAQQCIDNYCRVWDAASDEQRKVIKAAYQDERELARLDPLELEGATIVLDTALKAMAYRLVGLIAEAPADRGKQLGRMVSALAYAKRLKPNKRFTAAEIAQILRDESRRASVEQPIVGELPPGECIEPEETWPKESQQRVLAAISRHGENT